MIPAIVLAAGKSTRMGRPKALLPVGAHRSFLARIIETFRRAEIEDVIVVLGHGADAVTCALESDAVTARIVVNDAYESGQLSSVQAGLRVADRPGVAAILLTPVDVPLVAPETIRTVVDRFRRVGAPVVRPVKGDRHGHPVLVARSVFSALGRADPAIGARSVIRAHASPAGDVHVDDEGAFVDIDTPGDYERLILKVSGTGAG